MPSSVTRIINYIRKSRDEELKEEQDPTFNALERQKEQMSNVLKMFNVPFDQEMEYGSGDKIETRPVFQRVLSDIGKGKYQAIAVREISRLGRGSYQDMGQIYTLLEQQRIFIITDNNRIYDLRNQDDAKFIRMQLFMSREEYFMIKERLQGAREYFAAKGKFMSSRPPYGYVSNRKTKTLEIDPDIAKYVKMMFEWYSNEMGYQAIATRMTNMGVKTYTGKKTWQPLQVARLLKNRAYIGEIIYKATERIDKKQIRRPEDEWIVVENAHEPIISKDLFDIVQKKLINKKKNMPIILEFEPCELAGLVTCNCGRKMIRQYSVQRYRKDNGEESVYHKEFLYCRGDCRRTVKYRDVERYILAGLSEITTLSDEILIESLRETLNKNQNNNEIGETIVDFLQKQQISIQQKLSFIFEQYEDRVYTKDEFLKRKESLSEEMQKIEGELEKEIAKNQNIEKAISFDELRNNITTVVETYNKLTNKSLKNDLLRKIIDDVTVDVIEKGRGSRPSKLKVNISLSNPFINLAIV